MNHSSTDDDPYYHQSTSSGPSSSGGGGSYRVYTQKLQAGSAENPSSVIESGNMNAYIDNFLVGDDKNPSDVSSTEAYVTSHPLSSRSKADEDLDTLMNETADMSDIQGQIEEERHKMASKYRDEHTRQRRAAQARSRYQRMTENERKIYNQRRRMRQMGVDPTNEGNPGPLDNLVKTQARQANARKAEAARQRYHRMTPEQRKDYNQRRTEAFRRRREEEEKLLSTPAGRISAEALAKAQQIMVRNARKAESARLRYQKMTVEQRKAYNLRRAATKRTRKYVNTDHVDFPENFLAALESGGASGEPFEDDEDVDDEQEDEEEEELDMSDLGDMPSSSEIGHQSLEDFIVPDEATCELHMAEVINEVANSADSELSVFAQMESDVIRRTKKANTQILKKMVNNPGSASSRSFNQYSSFMGDLPNAQMIPSSDYTDPSEPCTSSTPSATAVPSEPTENRLIDEDALRQMIETGYDSNGMPVEVRTSDGQAIRTVADLISRNVNHGQTVFITQRVVEEKPPVFHTNNYQAPPPTTSSLTQDNQVGSTTSSHLDQYMNDTTNHEEEYDFEDDDDAKVDSVGDSRQEAVRARRAERARASSSRYHRMSEDQRREQNARRAATLRQARARDEELLKMCETTPLEQLDPETARQIKVAQDRRQRRAEQARNKYKRMSEEDRKRYNALRDASRKQRRVTNAHQHLLDDSHEDPMEDPPTSSSPLDPDDPASFFYGVFPPKT
ncbi:unnamed protein product [Caenorhabditis nigoni]